MEDDELRYILDKAPLAVGGETATKQRETTKGEEEGEDRRDGG